MPISTNLYKSAVIFVKKKRLNMPDLTKNQLSLFKLGYTSATKVTNTISNSVRSGSSQYTITADGEFVQTKRKPTKAKDKASVTEKRTLTMNKPKVRAKIIAFTRASMGSQKMKFITITFPVGLRDELCVQALNTWLTKLRGMSSTFDYLWVAERQGNGTLHFHLFTKTFFNIRAINFHMAVAIKNIVDKYAKGQVNFDMAKYNGVDVKVVNKLAHIVSYVTKYVTKVKELHYNRSWACSRLVSRLFTHVSLTSSQMSECVSKCKLVFKHDAFIYSDGTPLCIELYVPKEGAFMPYVSYIDAANEVVLMYDNILKKNIAGMDGLSTD